MPSSHRQPNVYHAKRVAEGRSLTLDGCGGDEGWQTAHVLTDFSFPWTRQESPATEFRALWNDHRLYFRFDVTDADVVLTDGAVAMEKVTGSDRVEIFFSTGPNLNPYFALEIDPRGEVLDYEARYHRQMNWAWSCEGLAVKSSLAKPGYIVEGEIPISTFQKLGCLHEDKSGSYLIAGLYRAEFSHDAISGQTIEDWMTWIDPQGASPDFHVPSSFGTIRLDP
ncbi:MAG: sugar-binding protein [Pirellulales bacterium]